MQTSGTPRLVRWVDRAAAAFVAAGGSIHLCFNVWRGEGGLSVPEGKVGLRHQTKMPEESQDVAAVSGWIREVNIATERRGGILQSERG